MVTGIERCELKLPYQKIYAKRNERSVAIKEQRLYLITAVEPFSY
jgi:hypothetical protein